MSTLVNYSGDDEFYPRGSFYSNPVDLGRLFSIGSHVDVYYPPSKRARISAPFLFGGNEFEQDKKPSIEVLPQECLFEIFRRIPEGKERSSCACVSKQWLMLLSSIRKAEICEKFPISKNVDMVTGDESRDLESDGYLTRCLVGKKATDIRLAAIAVGTSSRGGLGKLSIRGSNSACGVTDLGLSAVAHGCPSLKSLSLWDVSSIGDNGLSEIAKGCHLLEKLDLCQCPSLSNKGLIAIAENCPNLTTLNIESCSNIGNEGLQAIGRLCTKLQSLSIKECPLVKDHGVSSLVSSSSLLTKVKLEMCLRKCCFVSNNGLIAFAKAAGSLESLQLEECDRVTQLGIIGALSNCGTKLKSLTLVKCMGIRDMAMGFPVLSPCTSLRSLSIRHCPGFGTASLAMVGKLCPQIQHLDLSGLHGITDSGLLPLLESCEAGLTKVILSNCLNLTNEVILALTRLHGGTLELLNLEGCRKITDDSLRAISENCLLLNDLDVSNCAISNSGIEVLSCAAQLNLQVLSLSGCSEVSKKSMPFLEKLGKTLVGLNLQHCKSISSSTVELLVERLWRCDILS
ncbi:hypothetical protein I3842_03G233400 [Carya illinoinensis]|uniref:F-box/LRR-repeat protein 15-like leucin rich repeat domain-containing protein n=1 Tax=Carya illinoinensis TaxID=32201 RepID=A0A922JXH3_CARIL|nr:hypothetical protein I3842_03G233400 [Carya illinoinensis]